jgi:hypothetical protein
MSTPVAMAYLDEAIARQARAIRDRLASKAG